MEINKLAVDIGRDFGSPIGQTVSLGNIVSIVISASFALAGVILLLFLIVGGISIIAGAGNDNPEQMEKGKKAATSAVVGFIIVFVAYWVIRIIEVMTGTDFITAPGI
jgi:hypothetical protein